MSGPVSYIGYGGGPVKYVNEAVPLPVATTVQVSSMTNNISGNTTVKASAGFLGTVAVVVAGNSTGGVYNSGNVSGNLTGLQVGALPNTVGTYAFGFPMSNGISIVPGTGQTVSVSWA